MNSSDPDFILAFAAVAVIGAIFALIARCRTRNLSVEQIAANNARAVSLFALVRNGMVMSLASLGILWSSLAMDAGSDRKPLALLVSIGAIAGSLWCIRRSWRSYSRLTRQARELRQPP